MDFDEKGMIEAKKEYDRSIRLALKKLEQVKNSAWKIYMKRIREINKGDQNGRYHA